MSIRDIAVYVFLAIAWGCSFVVVLKTVDGFGWVGAVTLRAILAGVTLIIVAKLSKKTFLMWKNRRALTVVGFTTVTVQMIGLAYAVPTIGTAMIAIFVAAMPLYSLLFSVFYKAERLDAGKVVGIFLGLVGIGLLVGFPAATLTPSFVIGCIIGVASTMCGSFGITYANVHLKHVEAWELTAGTFLIGGLLTVPMLFLSPLTVLPTLQDLMYLAIAAIFLSAITYTMYFGLVKRIGSTRAISVQFVVTLVAVMIAATFLGEQLSEMQYVGGVVVLLSCSVLLGIVPLGSRRRSESPSTID